MISIKEKEKRKLWSLKTDRLPIPRADVTACAHELGVHPVVAKLLYLRGNQTVDSMKSFLSMEDVSIPDPFLMKDMELAVGRIRKAVISHEKIKIYGDFDADGVTAVSTLYLFLRSQGADVSYFIPNRLSDGYGVSKDSIDLIKADGTSLIITVDTGITAVDEIAYANAIGLSFVVTDHHECPSELPPSVANVNPHRQDCPYPFKDLAGVGVVFKLLCAYEERFSGLDRLNATLSVFDRFADLVSLGTIGDVMPIVGENRIIVSHGISMMKKNPRVGIAALIDAVAGKPVAGNTNITSTYIGFNLVSRINAAGRITSAYDALDLFLTDDYNTALTVAQGLCAANKIRQDEENEILAQSEEQLSLYADAERYPVVVLQDDHWHHGVVGIVAARILEKYGRPTILVSFEGNGDTPSDEDVGKGSGRSIKGLNLVGALRGCSDCLIKYGGHELAAGLSVSRGNLSVFRERINAYARENLTNDALIPKLEGDLKIPFSDVGMTLAEDLHVMEPFGTGNPVPVFLTEGCFVREITSCSGGKHTRLSLGDGSFGVTAMYFSHSPESLGFHVGDRVDVMFNLDVNEWNNRRSAQMIVKDIRLSEINGKETPLDEAEFLRVWNGGTYTAADQYLPSREDFKAVYLTLLSCYRNGVGTLRFDEMLARLTFATETPQHVSYVKLRIIVKVMIELNIMNITENENGCSFAPRFPSEKTDLEKSSLLKKIRNQQN